MTCEDFQGLILAGERSAELEDHLESCDVCRAAAASLRSGTALLEDNAVWLAPSDDLEDRIVDVLVADHAAGADEPIPTLEPAHPPHLHAVETPEVEAPVESNTPKLWALFGVAAVIIAGFLVVTVTGDDPDWTVEVGAGPAAPDASAVVDGWIDDGGTRMFMETRGLDPAPDGYFYEMWLSDGPLHISGGTFTASDNVELFVAVSRADFPRIWVTLEPIDEDESPSPEVVLDTGGSR